MAEIGSAFLTIAPSAKGFGANLNKQVGGEVQGSAKTLGTSFGKVFAAVAALGLVSKGFGFLKGSLEEAREAEVVGARTRNVIKSMGNAAKISAGQVEAMAGRLSMLTGIDDETIQSGENMLLTFGNIRNFVDGEFVGTFDEATALMVDMSAAMGTDMKGSAIQLGKALNDPTKGVSALTRVGVSFTEQQKEQIKTLQESGDMVAAQGIILNEVKKQFGGAAQAMVTPAMKAAVAWGNFKETVGTLLLPVVDRLLSALTPLLIQMGEKLPAAMQSVQAAVEPVVSQLRDVLAPVLERVGGFIRDNPEFVKAFAIALGGLAVAIGVVTLATAAFSAVLNTTGIPIVIIAIAALVAGLVVAYQKSEQFRSIVQQVGAGLRAFAGWIRSDVIPVVQQLATKVAARLRPVMAQAAETFRNDVLPAIQKLITKFREWQPTIQKVIGVVIRLVAQLIAFWAAVASKVLPVLIRFAGFIISKAVPAFIRWVENVAKMIAVIARFVGAIVAAGQKVAGFGRAIASTAGDAIRYISNMASSIRSAVSGLADDMFSAGAALIGNLASGIRSKIQGVIDEVQNGLNKIAGMLPGSPIKWGPLKSWNNGGAGQRLMGMLAKGISSGAPGVAAAMSSATGRLDLPTLRPSVAGASRGPLAHDGLSGGNVEALLMGLIEAVNNGTVATTGTIERRYRQETAVAGSIARSIKGGR